MDTRSVIGFRLRPASILAAAALACFATAGCGERDEPEAQPPPPEKAETVGKLPPGWTLTRNPEQGFELGSPPGWRQGRDCLRGGAAPGTATVLCSPDKLVTPSISADRTNEALELAAGDFAARTLTGLGEGYEDGLDPGEPKPFKGHYEGAQVSATGTAAGTGVRQNVSVVVIRRDDVANFTAVIAANADRPTEPAVKLAEHALRTLRSQPAGAG